MTSFELSYLRQTHITKQVGDSTKRGGTLPIGKSMALQSQAPIRAILALLGEPLLCHRTRSTLSN